MKAWIAAARPKTLPAAVVPVMVGASEAYRIGVFALWPVLICLAFSLLVQVATNMANDYFDHVNGADTKDRLGPERLVASGKIAPRKMFWVSVLIFGVAFLIGLNLVAYRGWELLIVGVLSIVFGYGYTGGPFPLAYKGLGDVFVVLFFGVVATVGTFYTITGGFGWGIFALGLALGFLANNILVVNNYRDLETDRQAGKMTLIARLGRPFGRAQYWVQLVLAFVLLFTYAASFSGKWSVLLGLLGLPLGLRTAIQLPHVSGKALNALLAKSAAVVLLVGVGCSIGILLAA